MPNTPGQTSMSGENEHRSDEHISNQIDVQQQTSKRQKRKYTEVWNFGKPTHTCSDCGAIMWYEERAKKDSNNSLTKFSIYCRKGKIELPLLQNPPIYLQQLLQSEGPQLKKLKEQSRMLNSIFALTSMGGKVDNTINQGNSPYVFRLNGQNHHKIGSLLPQIGERPRFTHLYIYDTENEISNRINSLGNNGQHSNLNPDIVDALSKMFDEHNELTKAFRMARERFEENDLQPIRLRLIGTRQKDGRQYNLPTSSEVAALIIGTGDNEKGHRDEIVEHQSDGLKRISELHPSFMAMQYPILFPYGEDGFPTNIPHADQETTTRARKMVTIREYYAFHFQQRRRESITRFELGRLNQQYQVDAFTCLQESRLEWVRGNQKTIRKEMLRGLEDAVSRGDTTPSSIGQRIVLPSSFTGSPRYMLQNYHDALAICKWAGPPDIFVTFTCNPNWQEIIEFLTIISGQRPEDRPDIIARVFKIKLEELMEDLKDRGHFGEAKAAIYTIEFQKRGLPHAHILLFLNEEDKPRTSEDIDRIISAELPDPKKKPRCI
ncbi:uncharacterized protein [Spinacia oleracea]|uniref:Helitron helicase-like domain-containing protein n=1 Tax=Spinacia oleracea TaxID=3562 RepID=A0ABM3QRB5_SPIOL|nr:uncharacterized protein LOC130461737 [Spinacia oleracea]